MLIQAWIIQIRGHWKAPNSKNRWQVLVVLTAWNSKKEFSYRQVHKKFRNLQWMSIRATLFALNSDQRNTMAFGRQKEGLSTSWNLPRNSHTRQAAKSLPATTSTSSTSQLMSLPLSFPFFSHINKSFDDFFRSSEWRVPRQQVLQFSCSALVSFRDSLCHRTGEWRPSSFILIAKWMASPQYPSSLMSKIKRKMLQVHSWGVCKEVQFRPCRGQPDKRHRRREATGEGGGKLAQHRRRDCFEVRPPAYWRSHWIHWTQPDWQVGAHF